MPECAGALTGLMVHKRFLLVVKYATARPGRPTMVNQKAVSHFAGPCQRERYVISISFACSCAGFLFPSRSPTGQLLIPNALLFHEKYERSYLE